jgi:SAM-dependent methyltransferase
VKLLRSIPENRSYESVLRHYVVEKEIAERIKSADREQRRKIYSTMYQELFLKVPDHPRLTRRDSKEQSQKSYKIKSRLLGKHVGKSKSLAEFAAGDCLFCIEISKKFQYVYAIDISDQRHTNFFAPENFELIIYDGYSLPDISDGGIDVVFSDQLIEHFHPEETELHFKMAYRILADEGSYIFSTPHLYSGPQDVSMYFSYVPECFHLKEWTYQELIVMLRNVGFLRFKTYWFAKGVKVQMPYSYFLCCENILKKVPLRYRRRVSRYFLPSICIEAMK